MELGTTTVRMLPNWPKSQDPPTPHNTPINPPTRLRIQRLAQEIGGRMSPSVAPTDSRIPDLAGCARSHLLSMMFMIPMPPTSSEPQPPAPTGYETAS